MDRRKSKGVFLVWTFMSVLVMPIMLDRESEQVTTLSFHKLEGISSNHRYWQSKGSIVLNGHSDKSFDSSTHLPFLPRAAAWLRLSPSLSQPISFPATSWAEAQMSIEQLCSVNDKEMQWEAVNRSMWRSLFEILQVLFSKPRLCKSQCTPSVTPPPSLVHSPPSLCVSCSPFHASFPVKQTLSHNSLKMWSVLSTTRLCVIIIVGIRHPKS